MVILVLEPLSDVGDVGDELEERLEASMTTASIGWVALLSS
jgi:hypothetical protein